MIIKYKNQIIWFISVYLSTVSICPCSPRTHARGTTSSSVPPNPIDVCGEPWSSGSGATAPGEAHGYPV